MLACLLAMLLPLSSEPPQVNGQAKLPANQSVESQSPESIDPKPLYTPPPIFGPEDRTPDFQLHPLVNGERANPNETGLKIADESVLTDAEGSEASTAGLESEERSSFGSVLANVWPYVLLVLGIVGWVVYQLSLKRAPSFKHHVIPERKQNEAGPKLKGHFKASKRFQQNGSNEESDADEVNALNKTAAIEPQLQEAKREEGGSTIDQKTPTPNVTSQGEPELAQDEPEVKGRFKVATRFQKPTSKEAASTNDEKTPSLKSTAARFGVQQQANESSDRPSDDEFELDFGDSASDSEVLSEEQRAKILEAAKILASVGKRKNGEDSSRK